MKIKICFSVLTAVLLSAAGAGSTAFADSTKEFTALRDTLPNTPEYSSGRIVVGDNTLKTLTDYLRETVTEPVRGTAVMFGKTADEETFSDDAALLAAGFDETDIAYLKSGADVSYAVKYTADQPKTYQELAADSPEKQKIDAFFSGRTPEPEDSLMTVFQAVRQRGTERPEILENVTDVSGKVMLGLLEEQGNASDFVKNGTFTVLYLGGDQAVRTEAAASPADDNAVLIDFTFIGNGEYMILYNRTDPAQTTDQPAQTTDQSAQATEQTGETAGPSAASEITDSAPNTADAGALPAVLTGIGAAIAAVLAGTQKRRFRLK